jgi:hypothetical protein
VKSAHGNEAGCNPAEVPEYLIPKPGLNYLDSYDHEFYAKWRPVVTKRVLEPLGR